MGTREFALTGYLTKNGVPITVAEKFIVFVKVPGGTKIIKRSQPEYVSRDGNGYLHGSGEIVTYPDEVMLTFEDEKKKPKRRANCSSTL